MRYRTMLCALLVCALTGGAERALIITKDGRELYGTIITDRTGTLIIQSRIGTARVKPEEIVERVPEQKMAAEIARRSTKLKPDDTEGHIRLSLLCLQARKWDAAGDLIGKAKQSLDKRLGNQGGVDRALPMSIKKQTAAEPKKLGTPKASGVSWPPPPGASFRIVVKRSIQGKTSEDKARWSRVARFLLAADPAFAVLPYGSTGDSDYVAMIGLTARVIRENLMFGSIPISREWGGRIRLTMRSSLKESVLYRLDVPEVRESASVKIKGGEIVLNKAFEEFMVTISRQRAFRFKK